MGIKDFFLKNTSTKQTFVKNTVWLFIGEFGSRLLKMVIFIYAARKLGVSEWGIFSYIVAIIGVVITFSDIGINTIITREVSKKTEGTEVYIATGFLLKVLLSIIGVAVILVLMLFLTANNEIRLLLPLAAIMFFLDSMQEFAFAINRAFEKMEIEAVSKIASNIIMVVVAFILLLIMPTAASLAYGYIAADIIATIIVFVNIRHYLLHATRKFNRLLLWPMFTEAWPIATISVFGVVLANIDTILLGFYRQTEAVGLYAAAQKPIQLLSLIPSLISTALLPIFSRLAFEKDGGLTETISRSINLVVLLALPVTIGGILLGHGIILLLFGASFSGAITIFKIMMITVIVSTPGVIASNALFADGKQKKVLYAIAIGAVSNLVFCFLLIPRFGIYGAAIATTISQIIYNIFIFTETRKVPVLRFTPRITKVIIATAIMSLTIVLLQPLVGTIILIIIAMIVYSASLLLLKEPIVQDVRTVLSV